MNTLSAAPGLPTFFVAEEGDSLDEALTHILQDSPHLMKADTAEILLQYLHDGTPALYVETGERLNPKVETIVVNYVAGIASFASPAGLVTGTFDPLHAPLTILITRTALEQSYSELLTYVGTVTSLSAYD
jgi:hypothetical protein